ncbi:uncharacterized protein LOC111053964 [Nilaparvata lugens]|uniref:uncharacterized protein LOC111053964 n=1 Tax=Nilaparvata lugens TaxID=108931 RepID=UPI00193C8BAA|nr:uncharacterized protein LOC111053964 [Nilaparvata lugens]
MSVGTSVKRSASEQNTFFSVLLISLMIFVFFKFCLGSPLPKKALQEISGDAMLSPSRSSNTGRGLKCPTGFIYTSNKISCKPYIGPDRKFSDNLLPHQQAGNLNL